MENPTLRAARQAKYWASPKGKVAMAKKNAKKQKTAGGKLNHKNACRRYRATDKGRVQHARDQAARRAREMKAPGSHTAEERRARFQEYGSLCAYCSAPATTLDHVVPLSKGGTDYISNCVPACKPCNSSKGDSLDWVSEGPIR